MCIASTPRKLNIAPISIQQQSVHRIGVNAPRKKKAASTARPAKAHSDEITSPRGNAIMSSIAAAVSLSKASAMPAPPVGNMEKSLCIAKTLTTSSKLDKREKGPQEATLLRGERGVVQEYSRKPAKAIHRGIGAALELANLPARCSEPAKTLRWAQGAFRVEKVRSHG